MYLPVTLQSFLQLLQSQVRLRRNQRTQVFQYLPRRFAPPPPLPARRALHRSCMQKRRRDLFGPAHTHTEPRRQLGQASLAIPVRFQ